MKINERILGTNWIGKALLIKMTEARKRIEEVCQILFTYKRIEEVCQILFTYKNYKLFRLEM